MSETPIDYMAGALHNMSAPPRTAICIRPLQSGGDASRDCTSKGSTPSLPQLFVIIDVHVLLYELFGRHAAKCITEITPTPEKRHLYLRFLIQAARVESGEDNSYAWEAVEKMAGMSLEELENQYLEYTGVVADQCHNLPPFALVRIGHRSYRVPDKLDMSPKRVLAIISHIAGMVYSRSRTPVIPGGDVLTRRLNLFAFSGEHHV